MGSFLKRVKAKIYDLGRLTPIAIVTAVVPMLGSSALLVLGYPVGHWLQANPGIGAVLFVLGVFFFCGLALLPTNLIGILAGWAFGFWFGWFLLIAGVVGSATISYFINLRLTGHTLTALTQRNARADAIHKALTNEGFLRTTSVITLIRMSVVMPFAFTNFFLAAARVPVSSYILGTFLGMLPRSGAMVLLGAGLSVLTFDSFNDVWFLAAGIPATLILIIVIGVLSRRALDRLTLETSSADIQPEMR
ncbi:MAG: VTT domain-containing protein [bacterium]|nr:VTT domain-containing protein [bacterium]